MSRTVTRRVFFGHLALGSAALAAVKDKPAAKPKAKRPSSKDKLNLAIIGVARRGGANLSGVKHENIVALCDADERQAVKARKQFPKALFTTDYRGLMDREDIDAVVISTPDHTHALPTVMALRAGKHVYCEKPLTHTVQETRLVTQLAAEKGLVTQMGTQIHAGDNYRRVVELVQSGAIGEVDEVHIWVGGSHAPGDIPDPAPVPEGLNYDLWIGPAEYRRYHADLVPGKWRGWWDFGGGTFGDMGCHTFDLAHWALDLRTCLSVEAEGPPVHPESTQAWTVARYQYPARGSKPPVKLTWYHGDKRPPGQDKTAAKDWNLGILFVGSEGKLYANYNKHFLLPAETFKDFKRPDPWIPKSIGHHREWTEACKGNGTPLCSFDYAGPLTETVQLGNVAYRSGKRLEWDHKAMKITNAPDANQFLRYEYRKGWEL